jgi:hypothetical protein
MFETQKRRPWQVVDLGMDHTAISLVRYKGKQEIRKIKKERILQSI